MTPPRRILPPRERKRKWRLSDVEDSDEDAQENDTLSEGETMSENESPSEIEPLPEKTGKPLRRSTRLQKKKPGKPEVEWQEFCLPPDEYAFAVRVYKCLKRPSAVAGDLACWDQRHDIDVWKHKDDPDFGKWSSTQSALPAWLYIHANLQLHRSRNPG